MEDLHKLMNECAAEAARVARGVTPDRLGDRTPCAEFDVRALVNHWVTFTSYGLECRARRVPLPEVVLERDHAGEDGWAETYAERLDRAVAAWAEPGVWQGDIDLGFMAMPAPELASVVVKEMAVHGWDVARATGQDFRASEALGALVLDVVERHGATYREYDGFADPVPVPDGASAFERAIALSGRDPAWR
ncbi:MULTISPECIES: TIGR03086 family metal-binding protein [Actinomadura]|uniref:TIGR03086 family metal-binding protein n=1 Tax=Actinomadura yumaensis TaxID=111807 RepID=A0ABW2CXT4_9ACTN|nr:TIGR03086 family metal-binding protein [Actinomadura sp. J1-007]MWK33274.1 TIGR03086 family protein [Actinomadura sp. J1-007]